MRKRVPEFIKKLVPSRPIN